MPNDNSSHTYPECWIYGRHAVLAALANPRRHILRLLVTANARAWLQHAGAFQGNHPWHARIESCDRRRIDKALRIYENATHQGIALQTRMLTTVTLDSIRQKDAGKNCLLALDGITDPRNVGAIIRLSAAFAVTAVLVPRRFLMPACGPLAKAAAGALEHLPIIPVANLARCLTDLKKDGFQIIGLDSAEATPLYRVAEQTRDLPVVLVGGAEGKGMRALTRKNCDMLAHIPFPGSVESLNVAQAIAIALYEFKRPTTLLPQLDSNLPPAKMATTVHKG